MVPSSSSCWWVRPFSASVADFDPICDCRFWRHMLPMSPMQEHQLTQHLQQTWDMLWNLHVAHDTFMYLMITFSQNDHVHDPSEKRPRLWQCSTYPLKHDHVYVRLCYLLCQHYAISPSTIHVSLWIYGEVSSLLTLFTEGQGSGWTGLGSGLDLGHSDRLSQSLGVMGSLGARLAVNLSTHTQHWIVEGIECFLHVKL